MTDLTILFEDEFLLVVDKPEGLLMHPSWLDRRETDTLAGRLKPYLSGQGDGKVHTVHRLDRPTSGLVVVAKHAADIARQLAQQFEQNTVKKTYWAIVRGFAPMEGVIEHPLLEEHDKIADAFAAENKAPQEAITQFQRLGISEWSLPVSRYPKSRFSWLEVTPKTGRKHQIRRHMKHLRHPLVGDRKHGCRHTNQLLEQHFGDIQLALRAVSIEFAHPNSGERVSVTAGHHPVWQRWLSVCGWA